MKKSTASSFEAGGGLPPAGSVYEYTLDEVREYAKCVADPVYFIKTYMKIINVDKGLIPFEMYDFQEDMVRSYHENRFNINMCSRQVGKSTTVVGYFLHYILFNVNVRACISANKQKTAVDLLGRLKLAYEHLPRFLQQGVVRWARMEIELSNGSVIFAAATSSTAVRGGSYNTILLDEFAFVPANIADEFYASTFPTISSGNTTKIIMVSTPNGMNLFHKFWTDAKNGVNDFKPLFVHWSQVPGRDEAWRESTIRNIGGPEKFAQEYECSFLSTQYTLIQSKHLMELKSAIALETTEDGYTEFVAPDPSRTYVITIDTGSGQGLDYSSFAITDVTEMPYQIVATYANNKITTMEYPQVIMKYATRYHSPWLMVEVMDIGRDVAHILFREFEYPQFMSTQQEKRLGQRLVFNNRKERHLGLRMTQGIKRSGCAVLKTLVENHQIVLNDYRIIQQLSTFVQKGSTYKAEAGHHDDFVMTLVMLSWASLQPNFSEITEVRALDVYTKREPVKEESKEIIKEQSDEPHKSSKPGVVSDQKPMPVGVFYYGGTDEEDDEHWLLR